MSFLSSILAKIVLFIGDYSHTFWYNLMLLDFSWAQIVLDIFAVTIIIYFILLLIKGSRAVQILIGLAIIILLNLLSKALELVTLAWLLDKFMMVVIVAIPIIFQKELRTGLEKLGHTKFKLTQEVQKTDKMILNVIDAVEELSKNKVGALIVIQKLVSLKEYVDTGVKLDAVVSKELLLSIFHPKGALHDGAVIIEGDRILSASCILPHPSEIKDSSIGTRHKAAIGLAENTDGLIIVVSEEKGTISFAKNGKLEKNLSIPKIHQLLTLSLETHKRKKRR